MTESMKTTDTQGLLHLHSLLVCTDSAARLWPLVPEHMPMELAMDPATGTSPLARAIAAVRERSERPLLIAVPGAIAKVVQEHIEQFGLLEADEYHLFVEPWSRGTALTTALAAAELKLTDPNAIMLVLPVGLDFVCDDRWEALVARAWQMAAADRIVVVGSRRPVCGGASIGSIRPGAEVAESPGVHTVRSYTAHPTGAEAWRARQAGALWSAHIYLVRANLVLSELRSSEDGGRIAETARFFALLGSEHWSSNDARELVKTLPDFSLEEALFETSDRLVVVPTSLEFCDLASFEGVEQCLEPDRADNRFRGEVQAMDSRSVTVLADSGRTVVVRGLENVVVIDTNEGLLIYHR
ncbi:MAG: hypothetical protein LBI64_00385 [Coriobacteriales bacterium]|jgi:mannose-1-phosphate guanylyltransferase|nr:hypothetical protein [Coriobacteriales bacterium]